MNNEERIKRWRQERLPSLSAGLPDEDLDDLADLGPIPLAGDERGARTDTAAQPSKVHEITLEEARAAIRQRRLERWRTFIRRAALFLGVPLVAILSYVTLIATPLYQGEAVFTVQTASDTGTAATAGLFGLGSSSATVADALKTREFILSRPMMNYMENTYGFMSHFESPAMDPLERFRSPLGTNGDPLEYYRKRVRVAVDVQEGLLTLYVQARTSNDAERFGNAILSAAERHVNEFSERMSKDQVEALTHDVRDSEREVADARRALALVQARRGDLNPEQTATAIYQLISNLELQLAEAKRERDSLLDQGLTNSPLLPRLNSRVQELQSQINEQRNRLASPMGGSMVRTVNEFENASARKELAETRYQTTLKTLQEAYLRILEQRRYFVTIVGLSVASYPAVRDIVSIAWPILLVLALLFAIVKLARLRPFGRRRFAAYSIRDWMQRWR